MPPKPIIDLAELDLNHVIADHKAIYQVNPHRFEFELLDAIVLMDTEKNIMAGYRDTKPNEFWVRGHIPGRPLFPGVLMIETAAQLVSYYAMKINAGKGFLGFGAVDSVKFRGQVVPGDRLIMLAGMVENRPRRCVAHTQGFVNGNMVYEGQITGMWI